MNKKLNQLLIASSIIALIWIGVNVLMLFGYGLPSNLSLWLFNTACLMVFCLFVILTYQVFNYSIHAEDLKTEQANKEAQELTNSKITQQAAVTKNDAIKFDRLLTMAREMNINEIIKSDTFDDKKLVAITNWYKSVNELYNNMITPNTHN